MTEREPPQRGETARRCLQALLRREEPLTVSELSQGASLREAEVIEHLEHVERTVRRTGERFLVVPARCLACEFEFMKRQRFRRPGRCPRCRSERIAPPRFSVEGSDPDP